MKPVTLPSVLIVKPLESARAKATADLKKAEMTEEEAKAIAEKAFKNE